MRIKASAPALLIYIILFVSCINQNKNTLLPVSDRSYFDTETMEERIDIGKITESKNGIGYNNIPEWLSAFLAGGIKAVENLNSYGGKYVFIAENKGLNFTALNKWADYLSPTYDFPMLAAARIEKRMISTSSLYPDDEYGLFFEKLVVSAYSGEYSGAQKEDSFWIKIKTDNEEEYIFFILITVDKTAFRAVVYDMIARTISAVSLSGVQAAVVERLRHTFFEGF